MCSLSRFESVGIRICRNQFSVFVDNHRVISPLYFLTFLQVSNFKSIRFSRSAKQTMCPNGQFETRTAMRQSTRTEAETGTAATRSRLDTQLLSRSLYIAKCHWFHKYHQPAYLRTAHRASSTCLCRSQCVCQLLS